MTSTGEINARIVVTLDVRISYVMKKLGNVLNVRSLFETMIVIKFVLKDVRIKIVIKLMENV